jgi:threonine dehydratase
MTDMDLDLDRISRAASVIDPVFLNSPQYVDDHLSARLGRPVLAKVETLNPLRSFKGRGADFLLRSLPPAGTVVCGSTGGNFGQAIAHVARCQGRRAVVFVPNTISAVKLDRIAAFDAVVHIVDGDPKVPAQAYATADRDSVFVMDGRDAAIAEGAATIGVELAQVGAFDAVVLPVGDGSLITGVARWLKARTPQVRVIGVTSAAAPAPAHSWRAGKVIGVPRRTGFAAGISVQTPQPEAVCRMRALVDDMVLVEDDDLVTAMCLAAETLGVILEPAGVAGLAAIARHDIRGDRVATVLTGGNVERVDCANTHTRQGSEEPR